MKRELFTENEPVLGEVCYMTSGCFKDVEIYKNYVKKSVSFADENQEFSNRQSYNSEDYSDYSDYSGNSNLRSENAMYRNDESELEKEFNFIRNRRYNPVLIPIVFGDKYEYIMPRASVASELDNKITKNTEKFIDMKMRKIIYEAIRLCGLSGKKVSYLVIKDNFKYLIAFGIKQKLSDKVIARALYNFLILEAKSRILSDMHDENYGLYKGRIVAFDLGNTRANYKSTDLYLKDAFRNRTRQLMTNYNELDRDLLYKLLRACREKTLVRFEGSAYYGFVNTVSTVSKVEKKSGSLVLHLSNGQVFSGWILSNTKITFLEEKQNVKWSKWCGQ